MIARPEQGIHRWQAACFITLYLTTLIRLKELPKRPMHRYAHPQPTHTQTEARKTVPEQRPASVAAAFHRGIMGKRVYFWCGA